MRRLPRSTALLLVTLLLTACGLAAGGPAIPPEDADTAPAADLQRWAAAQVDCLRAAGWDAVVTDRGFEVPDVRPDERHQFARARATCERQSGNRPASPSLDEGEVLAQYDALVELKECLEEQGYQIEEPPSREQFVESWATLPWHPYESVVDIVGHAEWTRLNETCPQPSR